MNPALFRPQVAEVIAALALNPFDKEYLKQTPPAQMLLGAVDFVRSFSDMKKRNLKGFDGYAHARANANATKRGVYGEKTAKILSAVREWSDALKHQDQNPIDLAFDIQADLNADKYGREQAKKYPNKKTHDIIQKYWVKDSSGQIAK